MLEQFNEALAHALDGLPDSRVKEAMNYSLQAGGKRLRPMLVLSACEAWGGNWKKALPAAIALEMVHTYSLIHDDLPAMDDDDLRRGKLTCHRQFDEATAILAGDGLLTEAFAVLAASALSDHQKVECVSILATAAGSSGMVLGQVLDMEAEHVLIEDLNELERIHVNKTGQLFAAALKLGSVVAEKTEYMDVLDRLGKMMGIAFQIQDDILDVTQNQESLGKSNSDAKNHKTTYVSLLSLKTAQQHMMEAYQKTEELLKTLPIHAHGIEKIILEMKVRLK